MNNRVLDIAICVLALFIAFTVRVSDPWWAHGLAGAFFGACAAHYLFRAFLSKIDPQ